MSVQESTEAGLAGVTQRHGSVQSHFDTGDMEQQVTVHALVRAMMCGPCYCSKCASPPPKCLLIFQCFGLTRPQLPFGLLGGESKIHLISFDVHTRTGSRVMV